MLRPIPENIRELRAKFSFERGNLQTVRGLRVEWTDTFDFDRLALGKIGNGMMPHVWDKTGRYRGRQDRCPRIAPFSRRSWTHEFDLVNGQDVDRKFVRTVRPRYSADLGIWVDYSAVHKDYRAIYEKWIAPNRWDVGWDYAAVAFRYMLDSQFKTSQEKPMTDHIPFDLEAAKRGEPIQLRNGQKCTFVALAANARADSRLIVHTSDGMVLTRNDDGQVNSAFGELSTDVVMVPKKVVRYVHFYKNAYGNIRSQTQDEKDTSIETISRIRVECVPGRFDE